MKQNFSTRENNETDSIPPKKKESQGELKVDSQVVKQIPSPFIRYKSK